MLADLSIYVSVYALGILYVRVLFFVHHPSDFCSLSCAVLEEISFGKAVELGFGAGSLELALRV